MNPQTSSLTLSDNRQLAFADLGEQQAPPIFFFHGSGSAADGLELQLGAQRHQRRIVSPSRPGIGRSTQSPGRSMSDWADDVAQLADHLALDRFGVLGISGGGPYALAVAAALPDRVSSVGVLSCGGPFDIPNAFEGMARMNRMMWSAIDRRPRLARFLFEQQAKLVGKDPRKATRRTIAGLRGADRQAAKQLSADQQLIFFAEPMVEALGSGPDGMLTDMTILRRPWDFDVAKVAQHVDLWHGSADSSAPLAIAEHLADQVPDCTLHVGAGAGHISTILDHLDSALSLHRGQQL